MHRLKRRIEVIEPYISDEASARQGRQWNILEKLVKLHNSDDTQLRSRPLIPSHGGGEERMWFWSDSQRASEMTFQ
jgi:hypothetical protein